MCRSNSISLFSCAHATLFWWGGFRAGNPTTNVVMADDYAALAAQLSAMRRQLAAETAKIERSQALSTRIEQSHEQQQQHVQLQREQQQAASRALADTALAIPTARLAAPDEPRTPRAVFAARVAALRSTTQRNMPIPIPNNKGTGWELASKRGPPAATIVTVHDKHGAAYPVRFRCLSDESRRMCARNEFVRWAGHTLSGLSAAWYRPFSELEKASSKFRAAFRESKGAEWSPEDTLTLDIADLLLLAEFVSFVQETTAAPASDLGRLLLSSQLETAVTEWLIGSNGLAPAASYLRQAMRLESKQYADTEPQHWRVLSDGRCVELRYFNSLPTPAEVRDCASMSSPHGAGTDGSRRGSTSSSPPVCFSCGTTGHTHTRCKRKTGDLAARICAIMDAWRSGNRQLKAAAIKYAKANNLAKHLGLE